MSKDSKITTDMKKAINARKKAQGVIKKAVQPLAKAKVKEVKDAAPKDSGALKKSLAFRIIGKSGKNAVIVVGPKVTYSFTDKEGNIKVPNKYAKKVDDATGFLSDNIGEADVDALSKAVKGAVEGLIK